MENSVVQPILEPALPAAAPTRPELLAPAGDWECVRAAVENGADAIYFGLDRFNARMRANNFTEADLPRLMEFLHARGVKGYVTFNTLVFPDELREAEQYLRTIIAAGVDAAIVQDVGVRMLRVGLVAFVAAILARRLTLEQLATRQAQHEAEHDARPDVDDLRAPVAIVGDACLELHGQSVPLAALDEHCREVLGGKVFADLGDDDKDTVLKGLESGDIALKDIDGKKFTQAFGDRAHGIGDISSLWAS